MGGGIHYEQSIGFEDKVKYKAVSQTQVFLDGRCLLFILFLKTSHRRSVIEQLLESSGLLTALLIALL